VVSVALIVCATISAKCELAIAGVEYRVVDNVVEWTVNEFGGGSELFLRSRVPWSLSSETPVPPLIRSLLPPLYAKITLNEPYTETMRKEFGPIRYVDLVGRPRGRLTSKFQSPCSHPPGGLWSLAHIHSLEFELPMYNCSNMKIRHLRVKERDASYDPYRWVRNITHANSYICRV
jgi:hypothetical protein